MTCRAHGRGWSDHRREGDRPPSRDRRTACQDGGAWELASKGLASGWPTMRTCGEASPSCRPDFQGQDESGGVGRPRSSCGGASPAVPATARRARREPGGTSPAGAAGRAGRGAATSSPTPGRPRRPSPGAAPIATRPAVATRWGRGSGRASGRAERGASRPLRGPGEGRSPSPCGEKCRGRRNRRAMRRSAGSPRTAGGVAVRQEFMVEPHLRPDPPQMGEGEQEGLRQRPQQPEPGVSALGMGQLVQEGEPEAVSGFGPVEFRGDDDQGADDAEQTPGLRSLRATRSRGRREGGSGPSAPRTARESSGKARPNAATSTPIPTIRASARPTPTPPRSGRASVKMAERSPPGKARESSGRHGEQIEWRGAHRRSQMRAESPESPGGPGRSPRRCRPSPGRHRLAGWRLATIATAIRPIQAVAPRRARRAAEPPGCRARLPSGPPARVVGAPESSGADPGREHRPEEEQLRERDHRGWYIDRRRLRFLPMAEPRGQEEQEDRAPCAAIPGRVRPHHDPRPAPVRLERAGDRDDQDGEIAQGPAAQALRVATKAAAESNAPSTQTPTQFEATRWSLDRAYRPNRFTRSSRLNRGSATHVR